MPAWDMDSAFFAKVAQQSKIKPKTAAVSNNNSTNQQTKQNSKKSNEGTKDAITENLEASRQFATLGNKKASQGDFKAAVQYFTKAIKRYQSDCRYYGNRSFCYEKLNNFKNALDDANRSIKLMENWPKGHFRKGRALLGLKRYIEAENSFKEVIKLDKHCADAELEIREIRVIRLQEMGFSHESCERVLKYKPEFQDALDELISSAVKQCDVKDDDVWVSDEENASIFGDDDDDDTEWGGAGDNNSNLYNNHNNNNIEKKIYDPNKSIWVGSVTKAITDEFIRKYFSQFGTIFNVKLIYEKNCGFVNFVNEKDTAKALEERKELKVKDTTLVFRLLNSHKRPKPTTDAKEKKAPKKKIEKKAPPPVKKALKPANNNNNTNGTNYTAFGQPGVTAAANNKTIGPPPQSFNGAVGGPPRMMNGTGPRGPPPPRMNNNGFGPPRYGQ